MTETRADEMDMSFGLQGVRAIDDPSWQLPAGQVSQNAGLRSPESGQRSGQAQLGAVAPDWVSRLADFLRREHPVKTADCVSARCRGQLSPEQVRKWLTRGSEPSGVALLWLATSYGPRLLRALFGPSPVGAGRTDWLAIGMQAETIEELAARLVALRAELDAELDRSRS